MKDCLFCSIAEGATACYEVWQSQTHMAFLTPFPNTPGVTVVIPKQHAHSYVFEADEQVMLELMQATRTVARQIDAALADVGRCGMVFEGFGIDHLHAKLFPLHGTADMQRWQPIESKLDTFFNTYPGYISSHDGSQADEESLKLMAAKLRGETA